MIKVVSGPPREDSIPISTQSTGDSFSNQADIAEVYGDRKNSTISVSAADFSTKSFLGQAEKRSISGRNRSNSRHEMPRMASQRRSLWREAPPGASGSRFISRLSLLKEWSCPFERSPLPQLFWLQFVSPRRRLPTKQLSPKSILCVPQSATPTRVWKK